MINLLTKAILNLAFGAALVTGLPSFAQQAPDQPPPSSAPSPGWRKFGEARPGQESRQAPPDSRPAYDAPQNAQAPPPPPVLGVPAGTWVTIRVDQPLASNRNQQGDTFTGTLTQPIVASGRVVARRGQMITGRVVEVATASRAKGSSRLGLEVTEIQLADGQQVPVKTQYIERRGDSATGDNVAAVGATTGVGAAIGAAAGGGVGAGLGAIVGAGASVIGVLVAHGKPAVVYPETVLTFRLEHPLSVSTERAEQAFEPVGRDDYDRQPALRQSPQPRPSLYYGPSSYYGGYDPYYWGPRSYFYGGPSLFFGRGYGYGHYGRGYRGR